MNAKTSQYMFSYYCVKRFESESHCNCVQCICLPIFHIFNLRWPHRTCCLRANTVLIAVKYQVSVVLSPKSPCWNTEDCQHIAYIQREEGWSWTTVGFNAWGLIYLRLPPCTLHTHPSLSDCIVRVLCVSLQLKVLKEMKTDYSGIWVECLGKDRKEITSSASAAKQSTDPTIS